MKFFIKLLLVNYLLLPISSYSQSEVKVYSKFEEFQKKEIKNVNKDNVTVINFWATWCVPCVKELPYFEAINGTSISGAKINVLLTSLDFEKNLKNRVIPFIENKKIKSPVVLMTDSHADKWINKIDQNWSGSIPATYILYKGKKYFFEKDYHNLEELQEEIKTIIKINKK